MPTGDHPLVWRAAVVALGLMGHMPTERDIAGCLGMEETDRIGVVLAAVLAEPAAARGIVNRLLQGAGRRARGRCGAVASDATDRAWAAGYCGGVNSSCRIRVRTQ